MNILVVEEEQNSEHYARLTLASIGDAVIVTNLTGQITFLNAGAERLTGWTAAAALGQPISTIYQTIDASSRNPLSDPTTNVLDQALCAPLGQALLITKAGEEIPIEGSATQIHNDTGKTVGVVIIFRDISKRKQMEEQRLTIERKLLETQRFESLGMLAGGIAHDFNNLLTAILGNTELALLDLPPDSPAQSSIQQIGIAARRATELTRQILAFAGKSRFIAQLIDLNSLITEMPDLLQTSITRQARLVYRLATQLPLIEGDTGQLRQVIMNLVINASEAIGDAEGTITISTAAHMLDQADLLHSHMLMDIAPGQYVAVQVADTGRGMAQATRSRIFEPFFTTKLNGRGLGLAAVQGIVRGHKGVIQIESTPGRGSIFTILLPCDEDSIQAATPGVRGQGPGMLHRRDAAGIDRVKR